MMPESEAKAKFASRFCAYSLGPNQNIPAATPVRVRLDARLFDSLNEFDVAAYIFTPRRAGYYLLSARMAYSMPVNGVLFDVVINRVGVAGLAFDRAYYLAGQWMCNGCSVICYLTPNDSIELLANNTDPINAGTVTFGLTNTLLCGHRLS